MTTVHNVNTKLYKKTHIQATESASLGLHCTPYEPNLTTQRTSIQKIKVVGACIIYIYIYHKGLIRFAAFPCKWAQAEPDALMETYYSHKKSHLACTRLSHVIFEATSRHVWKFPSRDEEKPPHLYVSKQIFIAKLVQICSLRIQWQ